MSTTETRPLVTAVEKKNQELATNAWQLLNGMKKSIADVLPKHLTPDRMAMIAFTAMRRAPKLLECSRESIIGSILTAAMLGLEPSGPLGHGALIPYGKECQFQPMYQGLLELSRRSGFIRDVQLRAVYKGDHYAYRFGLDPVIEHIPMEGEGADSPDREPTHFYAIVRLTNGGVQWDQVSYAQGLAHGKRYSPSFNTRDYPGKFKPGSVWADNPEAMILKTILKKVLKLCPKSPELAAALQIDDMADIGKTTNMTKMADGVFDIDIAEPSATSDTQKSEPAKGSSAIDRIVEEKAKNNSSAATATQPAASTTAEPAAKTETVSAQPDGDISECSVGDFEEIEALAKKCVVTMKSIQEHVTKTMGLESYGKLTKAMMSEVLKWISAKALLPPKENDSAGAAVATQAQFEQLESERLKRDIDPKLLWNFVKSLGHKTYRDLQQKNFARVLAFIAAGGKDAQ